MKNEAKTQREMSRAIMYSKHMDEPRICPSSIFCHPTRFSAAWGNIITLRCQASCKGENGDLEVCDLRLDAADSILGSINIILGVIARSQSTEEDENGDNDQAED